jgi:pimeloyl-ACP methyl ester carboxylesterase
MQNPSSTISSLSSPLAEVRAHDQVMRYRRAGQGRPLLVLRAPGAAAGIWPELDAHLAARFRVITPEIPAGCADVARWLAGFLEGLGIDRVVVLATDPCCLSALELALLDVSQVERLVLVPGGLAGETGLDGTLGTTLEGVTVPLLVVRRGLAPDEALPLVQRFLGSGVARAG